MPLGTPRDIGFGSSSGVGSTTTLTTTSAVSTGESIMAAIYVPSTASLSSVTDSAGNTYAIDASRRHTTDTSRYVAIASCHNAIALASGQTITFTTTASVSGIRGVCALAVSGVAAVSALDKTSGNDGSTSPWSTGSSGALSQANEVAVAVAFGLTSTANTPNAGWTETCDFAPQSVRRLVLQYQVVSSTSALNAGGAFGNVTWVAALATYKESSTTPVTITADTASATASGDPVTLPGVGTVITADTASATASGDPVEAFAALESPAQRVLSNGAWTWYNDPRAVFYNGTLYWGALRDNGDVAAVSLDLTTGEMAAFVLAPAFEVDDHDNPAFAVLPDGRLAAFWAEHNDSTGVRMRITTSPEDITAWDAETVLPMPGASASYANPWVLSGEGDRLYVFFRNGVSRPQVTYSDDDGGTWSTPRTLFGSAVGERPYVKYVSDGTNRIHFFASLDHPREATAGTCHMYHWYYDASDGNFHTSDGTIIRSLASLATTGSLTTAEVTKVYDATADSGGGNGNAWPWAIELDPSGKPVVAYSVYEALGDNDYHYARWTGSAWVRHTILTGQGSLYQTAGTEDQYVGGMAIMPGNTTRIYLSSESSGQWEIEQWTTSDGGATWAKAHVTRESSGKNFRPFCPRGGGPDVLWAYGTYNTYSSFETELRAWPAILTQNYRQTVDADSPLGVWRVDEAAGTVAEDAVGSNDGTIVGSPTLAVPGAIFEGTAIDFNGSSQRVDLPDLSVAEGSAWTYEAFVKTASAGYVVAEGSTASSQQLAGLNVTSAGEVDGFLRGDGGASARATSSGLDLTDDEWHHVAMVWSNPVLTVLADGVERDSDTGTPGARTLNKTAIAALVRAAADNWLNGSVDEVAIYTTALSPSRILAHFEARGVAPIEDLLPDAIASEEAVGTPAVVSAGVIEPTAIPSGEAVSAPVVVTERFVDPTGIASGEGVGTPLVQSPRKVVPVGIAAPDATGTPSVGRPTVGKTLRVRLNPGHQGIPTREAFGTPKLTPGVVTPSSIASAEAIGTPSVVIPQFVSPTAVPSAEGVGTPGLARPDTIIPSSVASGEQVGTPQISRAGAIEPVSIVGAEAVGSPTLTTLTQTVSPVGIGSAEVVNAPTVLRSATHVITPTGVPLPTVFGNPIVSLGTNAPITPPSIISRESFGLPRVTLGQPLGPPPGYVPGRIANRLYDTTTGVAFEFAINHSEEDPRNFERRYEAGAPTALGLVRQQSAAEPWRLTLRGTLLDPSQKTSLDTLYDYCDQNTLTYEDYSGESYEVIVTSWDCRPERVALNPFTSGLHLWRYTLELTILRVLHGAVATVIGDPLPTPPDITVVGLSGIRPVGIPTRSAAPAPVVSGGDIIVTPTPAGVLRVEGGVLVDSDSQPVSRLTGGSIHALPGFTPSVDFLQQIYDRGGRFLRIICQWDQHEQSQNQWYGPARDSLDLLVSRATALGMRMQLELHLNTGDVPAWTSGVQYEVPKYVNYGQFITQSMAERYGAPASANYSPYVMGFGLNEPPVENETVRNGNNAIPFLESSQRQMISWFRESAPDWIGFVALAYANQTPYLDAPRTSASATAYDAVGGNIILDYHDYWAGCSNSDPADDGRQPNGAIYPDYQGGQLITVKDSSPGINYVSSATKQAQMRAFWSDPKAYAADAGMALMCGEVGWTEFNSGKSAWWADKRSTLAWAGVQIAAIWELTLASRSQTPWSSTPGGAWDPEIDALLRGTW